MHNFPSMLFVSFFTRCPILSSAACDSERHAPNSVLRNQGCHIEVSSKIRVHQFSQRVCSAHASGLGLEREALEFQGCRVQYVFLLAGSESVSLRRRRVYWRGFHCLLLLITYVTLLPPGWMVRPCLIISDVSGGAKALREETAGFGLV